MSLMERLERQKKTNMTGNPASGPGRTTERFSAAAPVTEEYAELKQQVHAEVIDLITISPWDRETVFESVKKTHRLVICHEAVKQAGVSAEISAVVAEEMIEHLDAPVLRYGAPFCPIPFATTLEKMVKIYPEDLVKGIKGMF